MRTREEIEEQNKKRMTGHCISCNSHIDGWKANDLELEVLLDIRDLLTTTHTEKDI